MTSRCLSLLQAAAWHGNSAAIRYLATVHGCSVYAPWQPAPAGTALEEAERAQADRANPDFLRRRQVGALNALPAIRVEQPISIALH